MNHDTGFRQQYPLGPRDIATMVENDGFLPPWTPSSPQPLMRTVGWYQLYLNLPFLIFRKECDRAIVLGIAHVIEYVTKPELDINRLLSQATFLCRVTSQIDDRYRLQWTMPLLFWLGLRTTSVVDVNGKSEIVNC